ncbi:MAG: hypothetical protein IJF15_00670 [Oscillospiraceae bacterium]|nr:hypothetical protein [Oscillospiraceae bacterium]
MYNRYIRNDHGVYTRVSVDPSPVGKVHASPPEEKEHKPMREDDDRQNHTDQKQHKEEGEKRGSSSLPLGGFFERILGKFNLQDVDTGDIILLFFLFLLFEEKADEELLIALGLLLIL